MKAVIFAGGVGTRMWPLSRKRSPKQFEKIIADKSTLQLAVERLRPEFAWEDIYVSSGEIYQDLIRQQLPQLSPANIIIEPQMRDVAPAVGYVAGILARRNHGAQPFAILWSDHLIQKVDVFKKIISVGNRYIRRHPGKILFFGQRPRFPNQNLGWIKHGKRLALSSGCRIHEFVSWHYRPSLKLARQYFHSRFYSWNPGYWIATPKFILTQYRKFMPEMYQQLAQIQASVGSKQHQAILQRIYPQLERISFDNAILERLEPGKAVVLTADMGWSDVGAWEALKEALQTRKGDNITHGKVFLHKTRDCLVYNYTPKLVTTVGLKGVLVIATEDVILVCPEDSVPEIKKVVSGFAATANEKYT